MYDKNFDAFAVAIAEAIYQTCEELNI